MNKRIIHVLIVEQNNPECLSIGVIDNITIYDKESFIPRLKIALDEHFDGDTKIVSEFVYEDLFSHIPVDLSLEVDCVDSGNYLYNITIAETWLY